jgi:membrane-bound lytic murein transglycosylase B
MFFSLRKSLVATLLLTTFLSFSTESSAKSTRASREAAKTRHEIEVRMKGRKFSPSFIRFVKKNFEAKNHERVLRLNTLGFLNPVDHHVLVTDEAIASSKSFLKEHEKEFDKAESLFGVKREVIAALLWVETRHGNVTGNFLVPSVYASLIIADTKRSRNYLIREAKKDRLPATLTLKDVKNKIKSRTTRKVKWAIEELRVLEKIFLAKKQDLRELKGSFAGAFGIPQFLPSSYQRLAYTDRPDAKPNLDKTGDAILSVANYLKKNGWNETSEAQHKAIYSYNNSTDYVEAILELGKTLANES